MGASATLSTPTLTVEPGSETTCSVLVANTGEVVDQFTVDVVGDAAAWTVVEPPMIGLMPGESATVNVRFAPPRSWEVIARPVHFGVQVSASNDPYGSVVEEGVVEVTEFTEVTAELVPAKAEGSTKAKFEVAVDNAGNHPVEVELRPADREDDLDFRLDRSRFVLEPGTAAFIRLQARPRRRFLRGQPQRHPFQVFVSAGAGGPIVADGTMVQRQLLPRWLLPALIALLALAAVLAALWFAVLKPAVKSVAREAAEQESAEIQNSAAQAQQEAVQAKGEAAKAKENADRAMEAAGLDPANPQAPPTRTAPAQPPPSEPTDFRVAANSPRVADADDFREFPYTPPEGKTLLITDYVLQNPRGDSGTLQILRDADGTQTVLVEVGLNNFRDLDQHFSQPWRFRPGERIIVAVSCQNVPEKGSCTPAVSFSGRVEG